eukprot:241889-Prymnesium_polylepis.1
MAGSPFTPGRSTRKLSKSMPNLTVSPPPSPPLSDVDEVVSKSDSTLTTTWNKLAGNFWAEHISGDSSSKYLPTADAHDRKTMAPRLIPASVSSSGSTPGTRVRHRVQAVAQRQEREPISWFSLPDFQIESLRLGE